VERLGAKRQHRSGTSRAPLLWQLTGALRGLDPGDEPSAIRYFSAATSRQVTLNRRTQDGGRWTIVRSAGIVHPTESRGGTSWRRFGREHQEFSVSAGAYHV